MQVTFLHNMSILTHTCIYQLLSFQVKLEAAVEDGILTKKSLDRVSAELEAKEEELRSTEEHLKTTKHVLKAKEEECYALEVGADMLYTCMHGWK